MNFVDALATARHNLSVAEKHATMDVEFFQAHATPAEFAKVSAAVAVYAARVEALRPEVSALEAVRCIDCDGTGIFAGASRRFRDNNGKPKCFACKGHGRRG